MVTNPFGQGLSLRLSARTRDFEDGVDDARDALAGFGASAASAMGPMQGLQGRADEAGDELADVGREAGQASRRLAAAGAAAGAAGGAFSTMTIGTHGLNASLGSLTTSLAGTIGLLGVLATAATGLLSTLVPLAAILGAMTGGAAALAGAFGAVIGSGIVAYNERLQEVGSSVVEEFKRLLKQLEPIIAAFGEEFVPIIAAALNEFPGLVREMLAAAGGMGVFADAVRRFGRAAARWLPRFVAFMSDLARRAIPVARDFFGWLLRNGGAIFGAMLRTTQRLAPIFLSLIDAFIQAGPQINELGTRILETLVPALSGLISTFDEVLTQAFAPGGGGFFGALTSLFTQGLNSLADWMEGGGKRSIRNTLINLFNSIATILTENRSTFEDRIFTPLQVILSGLFNSITSALQSDEAGALGEAVGNTAASIMRLFADEMVAYAASDAFVKDLSGLSSAVGNSVGRALVAGAAGLTPGGADRTTADVIQDRGVVGPAERGIIAGAAGSLPGVNATTSGRQIIVTVEGDTDVIRRVTAEEFNAQGRRVFNQTGSR